MFKLDLEKAEEPEIKLPTFAKSLKKKESSRKISTSALLMMPKSLAVNKADVDVFLELFCFFDDPADVNNLISGSFAFSKTSLNIRKFAVHVLLKPGLENFEHDFTSV